MTLNRAHVATTLAAHIGVVLTPEVAMALARALCSTPSRAFDLADFPSLEYKGYVIALERFTDVLPDLHKLHEMHYAETETYRAGIPFNPDYDALVTSEHEGQLMQFTARFNGELVGNMRVYLGMSRHTKTLFASEDTFFVVPAHRGGFMAVRLWQFAERAVIQAGAREIHFDSKTVNKADAMAKYLKYQPVAIKFAKVIPKE